MSALTIDALNTGFAPQIPVIQRERLADVIQLPARWHEDDAAAATTAAPVRTAPRASAVRAQTQPIRLTARGKLMVRVVASILALGASIGIGAALGTALQAPVGELAVVVVEPGQSLWTIASAAAAPGQDVRDVMAEIASLNALSDSTISAGQQLSVPVR